MLMKFKRSIFAALVFSVLFTSCFNNLKAPKETSVSFYMDEATVQKILQTSAKARSAASSRAATDEQNDTAGYFIDVTLIGEVEQTQTASLSTDVQMSFTNILVNSRVYAKAQIYKYLNSEQSEKEIIYRGESKKITVRDNGNVLSIKLTTATLTVTFDSNGGSEVPSQLVLTGSATTEPEKPVKPADKKKYSKDNFAFAGWFTDAELTKEYNFELPVKDDLTLYAKWLPDFVFVEGATVNDYLVTGRNIKISDLFVSDHEVTQTEYKAVIGSNPSNNKTADDLPVENVTWLEAIEYCNKLSESQGLDPCYKINGSEVTCTLSANGYRLPTEAEWEYIANKAKRENTSFSNLAWTADNSGNNTHQVKYNLADELCLCDIYGNVAEWCFDVYSEAVTKSTGATGPMAVAGTSANRVVRGGSFQSSAAECTPQARASADPAEKSAAIGFRVVRTVVYEFKIARNTVTFEPNGGSSVEVQIVIQGDCATEPAAPTRTGYIFKGWQYADEDFDFSTSITQDIMLEAKWEAIKYKVKFNGGASTTGSMPDQEFTYDVEAELSENQFNPPSNAWKFGGWSKTLHTNLPAQISFDYSDKQNVKNLSSQNNDEITLYALWIDKDACSIQYLDVPDDVTNSNAVTFRISQNVTLTNLTRDYYTFDGWYIVNDDSTETLTTGWSSGTYESNLKLRAKWTPIEYNWTIERNGGSWNSYTPASTYNITQTITLPGSSQITKEGYDFAGWYDGWDSVNATVSGNNITGWAAGDKHEESGITLYAKWIPGDNHYKVQHWQQKTNGGENPVTNYTCFEEETITLKGNGNRVKTGDTTEAAAKSYEGFTNKSFEQTTVDADGSTVINIYYNRNEITYKFVIWAGSWGSTETPDGEGKVSKTGLYGAAVVLPDVDFTGYNFSGWQPRDGDETYTSLTYGATNREFEAVTSAKPFTVTFHPNGGTIFDEEELVEQFTITSGLLDLENYEPDRYEGTFEFVGWYTDESLSTPVTGNAIDWSDASSLHNWNLYAKWKYTVSYATNGGSVIEPQIYYNTQNVTQPTAPTRDGFTFAGWYKDQYFNNAYTFGSPSSTGSITLYARWSYKVTYVSNGATIEEQTYYPNENVYPPTSPTRDGFTLDDWYTNTAFETRYAFGSPSSIGDVTLYAKWTYWVKFNTNGGTSISQKTLTEGQPVTAPTTTTTKTGYELKGWFDQTLTTEYEFGSASTTGNLNLYAKWELETYHIYWHNELIDSTVSGGGELKETYQYTDDDYTLPSMVRDEYQFGGWCTTDGVLSTKVTKLTKNSTGDKHYYAYWTSMVVEVSTLSAATTAIASASSNNKTIRFTEGCGVQLTTSNIQSLKSALNGSSYSVGLDLSATTLDSSCYGTLLSEGFKESTNLISISLPSNVVTVGTYCFAGCTKLEKITLPESVETIATYAFNMCGNNIGTKVITLTLGKNVSFVDSMAFAGTIVIEVDPANETYMARDGVLYEKNSSGEPTVLVAYPIGVTSITDYVIPDTVTSIKASSCYNAKFQTLTIHGNISEIPSGAFQSCILLKTVTITKGGAIEFKSRSFNQCLQLESISYTGTESDWNSLVTANPAWVNASNEGTVVVTCSDGGIIQTN